MKNIDELTKLLTAHSTNRPRVGEDIWRANPHPRGAYAGPKYDRDWADRLANALQGTEGLPVAICTDGSKGVVDGDWGRKERQLYQRHDGLHTWNDT